MGDVWAVKVSTGIDTYWLDRHGGGWASKSDRHVGTRGECATAVSRFVGGPSVAEEVRDIRFVRIKRKPKAATVNAKKVVGWMFKTSSGGWAILQVYDESKRARLHGTDGDCAHSIRNVWTSEYHAKNDCEASGLTGHVVPYYADGSVGE